jgi:hypothetical protein
MQHDLKALLIGALMLAVPAFAGAAKGTKAALTPEAGFTQHVQPFLAANCLGCHNAKVKTANLDLSQFKSVDSVRSNLKVWRKVAWKLEQGDMPPAKTPQPKAAAKKAFLKWVNTELTSAPVASR